jgi:hypothetical protein
MERRAAVLFLATHEAITNTNYSFNALSALTQLLPQPADMNIQRTRIAVITVAPNVIEQLLSRYNSIGGLRKRREQRELLVGQLHFLASTDYANVVEVDQ